MVGRLLEGPSVRLAGSEGTALCDSGVEVHGDEIVDVEEWRVPSTVVDATVQPVNGTVGTSGLGDILCEGFRVERKFRGSDLRVAPLGPHLGS